MRTRDCKLKIMYAFVVGGYDDITSYTKINYESNNPLRKWLLKPYDDIKDQALIDLGDDYLNKIYSSLHDAMHTKFNKTPLRLQKYSEMTIIELAIETRTSEIFFKNYEMSKSKLGSLKENNLKAAISILEKLNSKVSDLKRIKPQIHRPHYLKKVKPIFFSKDWSIKITSEKPSDIQKKIYCHPDSFSYWQNLVNTGAYKTFSYCYNNLLSVTNSKFWMNDILNSEKLNVYALGAGSWEKDLIVINSLKKHRDYKYHLIEFSPFMLTHSLTNLEEQNSAENLIPICSDFFQLENYLVDNTLSIVTLLGGTLGNLDLPEYVKLMKHSLEAGDYLIISAEFFNEDDDITGELNNRYNTDAAKEMMLPMLYESLKGASSNTINLNDVDVQIITRKNNDLISHYDNLRPVTYKDCLDTINKHLAKNFNMPTQFEMPENFCQASVEFRHFGKTFIYARRYCLETFKKLMFFNAFEFITEFSNQESNFKFKTIIFKRK